jgi:hypothetical protein
MAQAHAWNGPHPHMRRTLGPHEDFCSRITPARCLVPITHRCSSPNATKSSISGAYINSELFLHLHGTYGRRARSRRGDATYLWLCSVLVMIINGTRSVSCSYACMHVAPDEHAWTNIPCLRKGHDDTATT